MARIIALLGDIGSGKTALLTAILYDAHLAGKPIIANYGLEFPCLHLTYAQLAELPPTLKNAYIGSDELQRGADAYDFLAPRSRKLITLSEQLRKRNATWIFTTQRLHKVVLRLREVVQEFYLCVDLDASTVDHSIVNADGHPIHCKGQMHIRKLNEEQELVGSFIFDSTKVRHLYNSNEIVYQ